MISSNPVGTVEENAGKGICMGYTTDTGEAVYIPYDLISPSTFQSMVPLVQESQYWLHP